MLFEEEGKPAVAPMPFFQFPRIAPAVLTSAPPLKRSCFSFGKKAPSATMTDGHSEAICREGTHRERTAALA
jgi:hypothetical protein|tara:strand:+ start:316 stop:531 length:216 start_codon:yes stop_codon:yes gene_type:complete